jgi:beta-lactamase superfamily II metal-dependent hydrolase
MAKVAAAADAASMKLHFLDMGKTMYGDSIVARIGSRTILIDGGHKGDYQDHDGSPGIPTQLAALLGHAPPFRVSLLVVTHCHSDHIGCLPRLVADGTLAADWALVADENLGFGTTADGDNALAGADVTPQMRKIVAALSEENLASARNDAELAELIDAADALEPDYKQMLRTLQDRGTRVVRYGRDSHAALTAEFAASGLKIVGPTEPHLFLCAEAIRQHNQDALTQLRDLMGEEDAPRDVVGLFRALAQSETDDPDLPGLGAAKNNQSIVLSLAAGGWKALLTGDMQFAKAEIPGLGPHMTALASEVVAAGPYDLHKTAHHSSYNGVNDAVIDAFGAKTLVHTGGWDDPGHPSAAVLKILRRRRQELTWARTDKNGQITAERASGKVKLTIARGRLNNAAANRRDDTSETQPTVAPPALQELFELPGQARPPAATVTTAAGDLPNIVEVTAKVPHVATRVVLTIDVQPQSTGTVAPTSAGGPQPPDPRAQVLLGGGRQLPKLLFVTNRQRLAANLGQTEAAQALGAIQSSGHLLLDNVAADIRTAPRDVIAQLRSAAAQGVAGVVLVGGYDVVPSQRFDALPRALRQQLSDPSADQDDFIVWSDDVYGCIDGDDLPDLPVSRIPDGKSPQVVFRALSAGGHAVESSRAASKFCVRNFHRPFAAGVFGGISGSGNLEVSERLAPRDLLRMPAALAADSVYVMLHGADFDATRFWGETAGTDLYETMNLDIVPAQCGGVIFSGCCWGAMPVNRRASHTSSSTQAGPRTAADSLALAFLSAGARAFVGCTGVHYSPTVAPYQYFGGPMHQAFWSQLARTGQPARALFEAKKAYLGGIPHRRGGSGAALAQNQAIELKIMRQYTCLGLGW